MNEKKKERTEKKKLRELNSWDFFIMTREGIPHKIRKKKTTKRKKEKRRSSYLLLSPQSWPETKIFPVNRVWNELGIIYFRGHVSWHLANHWE